MSKFLKIFSKQDIKFAAIGSLAIKFGSAFFAFINSIILARTMGKENFGYYILAYSTILILSVPVNMGLPMLLTRYISKYKVANKLQEIKGIFIISHKYVFFTTIIVYLLAFSSYFIWWNKYNPVLVNTLIYGFILLPLLAFGSLRAATLRGLKFVILAELPETFLRNIFFTILLLFSYTLQIKITPQLAMIFQIIVTTLGFAIGFLFLWKKLLATIKQHKPIFNKKEWFKQTIPFTINSSIQVVKNKILTYILAIFGSIEAVAIFEVAMRGASLVSFTLDALNLAIAPYISSAFEHKNHDTIQRIIKKTGRLIFIFSLPVALTFIIGGKAILELLYGKSYLVSYIPLVILCVGQLISSIIGSVGLLLNMTGNQSVLSKSNIIALFLNIMLSIPFIIYFDSNGAAFVYSFVLILQNIYLLKQVKNKLSITTTII